MGMRVEGGFCSSTAAYNSCISLFTTSVVLVGLAGVLFVIVLEERVLWVGISLPKAKKQTIPPRATSHRLQCRWNLSPSCVGS